MIDSKFLLTLVGVVAAVIAVYATGKHSSLENFAGNMYPTKSKPIPYGTTVSTSSSGQKSTRTGAIF